MEKENKLTVEFLSNFFNVDTLLGIYCQFFDKKDGLTQFVYYNEGNRNAFNGCLIDFITGEISEYVTKEELIENGYMTKKDFDLYQQQSIYDKVSHYYDNLDNTYSIDAWKQGNDDGEVVAIIDVDTLSVTYLVDEAKYSQSVVDEIKKVLKKIIK